MSQIAYYRDLRLSPLAAATLFEQGLRDAGLVQKDEDVAEIKQDDQSGDWKVQVARLVDVELASTSGGLVMEDDVKRVPPPMPIEPAPVEEVTP